MQIGNLLLILLTEQILLPILKKFAEELNESKIEIVHPEEKKIEKKEQMSIGDDEKRENASIENSLMKKLKIKNEFEGQQKK